MQIASISGPATAILIFLSDNKWSDAALRRVFAAGVLLSLPSILLLFFSATDTPSGGAVRAIHRPCFCHLMLQRLPLAIISPYSLLRGTSTLAESSQQRCQYLFLPRISYLALGRASLSNFFRCFFHKRLASLRRDEQHLPRPSATSKR